MRAEQRPHGRVTPASPRPVPPRVPHAGQLASKMGVGGSACAPRGASPRPVLRLCAVIPKLNCVFAVETDGFVSYIYGSKFQLRSSERSAKKFKAKGAIDL